MKTHSFNSILSDEQINEVVGGTLPTKRRQRQEQSQPPQPLQTQPPQPFEPITQSTQQVVPTIFIDPQIYSQIVDFIQLGYRVVFFISELITCNN